VEKFLKWRKKRAASKTLFLTKMEGAIPEGGKRVGMGFSPKKEPNVKTGKKKSFPPQAKQLEILKIKGNTTRDHRARR